MTAPTADVKFIMSVNINIEQCILEKLKLLSEAPLLSFLVSFLYIRPFVNNLVPRS